MHVDELIIVFNSSDHDVIYNSKGENRGSEVIYNLNDLSATNSLCASEQFRRKSMVQKTKMESSVCANVKSMMLISHILTC